MPPSLRLVLCIAMGVLFARSAPPVGAQQAQPSPTTRPAIAIYVVAGMGAPALQPTAPAGPKVILAAWEDGQIVWSTDYIAGGPPYLTGRFDPKLLTQMKDDLGQRGAFANKALARLSYGPDSSFTVIRINGGQQQLELRSWHELFEQNPKTVATAGGITSLNGRDRQDVLRNEPAEYRLFRAIWNEIRTTTKAWIPKDAKPWNGTPRVD